MKLTRQHWLTITGIATAIILIFIFRLPSMENVVKLIIGVAWPATVLILAWLFRGELSKLIGRVKKIGKEGAEFEPPQSPPKGDPASPGPVTLPPSGGAAALPANTQDKPPIESAIAPVYRLLLAQLIEQTKERLIIVRNLFSSSETDIAITWAAEIGAALHLERASRLIFQSQLDALDAMKWRRATKADFKPFYDQTAKNNPLVYANYSFDQWFNFLVWWKLVSGSDDAITVTPAGEAISMYMAEQGYKAMPA